MVIGLLTLAAIPTTIGVAEGVSHQRRQNADAADEKRMAKFHVDVYCDAKSSRREEVHGKRLVLRDDKVYIDDADASKRSRPAHPVTAFYIAYPDEERAPTLGLVSTIADDPPMLNWIYVDKETLELRYGNRTQSREHHVGPWDWTKGEDGEGDGEGLVFEGWEGFVVVEEGDGKWGVRFDRRDDGLKGVEGVKGKRVLQVSLERRLIEGG
ncbi:MAG: hypothetical protein M1830_004834 [Pleopsidium flavum]|nr:MAG: hypothetical protein M1830_004834 [Pleopsidium flavum]